MILEYSVIIIITDIHVSSILGDMHTLWVIMTHVIEVESPLYTILVYFSVPLVIRIFVSNVETFTISRPLSSSNIIPIWTIQTSGVHGITGLANTICKSKWCGQEEGTEISVSSIHESFTICRDTNIFWTALISGLLIDKIIL